MNFTWSFFYIESYFGDLFRQKPITIQIYPNNSRIKIKQINKIPTNREKNIHLLNSSKTHKIGCSFKSLVEGAFYSYQTRELIQINKYTKKKKKREDFKEIQKVQISELNNFRLPNVTIKCGTSLKKPKGKKEEEKNNELYMQQVHIDRERGTGHKEIYQKKRAITMTIKKSMK